MTEAERWRKQAAEWLARAQTSEGERDKIDWVLLAAEAMALADDLDANLLASITY